MRSFIRALFAAAAAATLPAQSTVGPRTDGGSAAALAWQRFTARSHAALGALNQAPAGELPPLPDGVTELAFAEFFGPIGDRGLEYSPRLKALDGQRVRLVGYMVREQTRTAGLFLFAGLPATVSTKGLCAVDSTPPSAVHVFLPLSPERVVPYRPGRIHLIGRLELGVRPEADGRNSTVRLILEPGSAAQLIPPSEPPAR